MKNLASLGKGIFLGDRHQCDQERYDKVIHIWRQSNIPDRTCEVAKRNIDHGLKVRWREGESLDEMDPRFEAVLDYCRRPGTLLIHCSAGICRSAQLSVAALIVRGIPPIEAVHRVYSGMWHDYEERHTPDLVFTNMHDMFCRLGW